MQYIFFFGFRVMKNIGELMSGILFNQLFSCILFLALMLFSMDQSKTFDTSMILGLQSLVTYLMIGYLYCRLSENMTEKCFEIGDVVYNNLFWYKMSVNERKCIMFIIRQSQKEFRLKGLGMINCSLATYLTVISNFNYFLISVKV